jgi:DNA-binding NarL/FixJ family response regulator
VLADDPGVMLRRLRLLLDGDDAVAVVAEAPDLAAVARCVHLHRPDVLVIDLSMSNGSSIEAIRRLRRQVPGTAIVVLTMESSRVFARETRAAGAIGFVVKQVADAELAPAIRGAARGEAYTSPLVAGRFPRP